MADRTSEFRINLKKVVLIGLGAFLLVNGCSWNPGYGGRNDRKPGAEVERYFCWPACFYADFWQSDKPTSLLGLEPWEYTPPLPISGEMCFLYCRFGIAPLVLDLGLILAGMGFLLIFYQWDAQKRLSLLIIAVVGLLFMIGWAIISFGDQTSVYL